MVMKVCIAVLAMLGLVQAFNTSTLCPTAIFSFADSLTDSGNLCFEALAMNRPGCVASERPYGMSLAQGPTGRYCDGKIIVDWLAEYLHISELVDPSLLYNDSTFRGLNFGYAGATVLPQQGVFATPHIFPNQIQDFLSRKKQVEEAYPKSLTDAWYSNALYFIEIGGDDLNYEILPLGPQGVVQKTVPQVIQGTIDGISMLYQNGARNFLLLNMPMAGCSPLYLKNFENVTAVHRDEYGCILEVNQMAQAYNAKLKEMMDDLRKTYTDANLMYFDWYAANVDILKHADFFGFDHFDQPCCGQGGGPYNCRGGQYLCGCDPTATPCSNPDKYISWDGIHYTQNFYRLTANAIVLSRHMDPPTTFVPRCAVPVLPLVP